MNINPLSKECNNEKDKSRADMEAETNEFISSTISGFNIGKGDMNSGLGYKPNTLYCFGNSLKGKHCNICRDKLRCKDNTILFLKEETDMNENEKFVKEKFIESKITQEQYDRIPDDAKMFFAKPGEKLKPISDMPDYSSSLDKLLDRIASDFIVEDINPEKFGLSGGFLSYDESNSSARRLFTHSTHINDFDRNTLYPTEMIKRDFSVNILPFNIMASDVDRIINLDCKWQFKNWQYKNETNSKKKSKIYRWLKNVIEKEPLYFGNYHIGGHVPAYLISYFKEYNKPCYFENGGKVTGRYGDKSVNKQDEFVYSVCDSIKDPFLKDKVVSSFVYEGLVNDDTKEDNI